MSSRPRHTTAQLIGDGSDRLVDVHAPEAPPAVRQAVLQLMQPGGHLWCCPRRAGRTGLRRLLPGLGETTPVIEWWLVNAEGDLVEAFWEAE